MISRSSWKEELAGTSDKHRLPEIDSKYSTLKRIPGNRREIEEGFRRARELISNETRLYLDLLNRESWDFFYCYSSCLDWVQHYSWPSERDASSLSLEPLEEAGVPEFYEAYDRMVNTIISGRDEPCAVIVASDHGHERRPTELVNTNSVISDTLRKFPNFNQNIRQRGLNLEVMSSLLTVIQNTMNPWKIQRLAANHPFIVRLYHALVSRRQSNRAIQAMSISKLKAYRYGGIVFSAAVRKSGEYEKIREEVIRSFSNLIHPVTEEHMTLFACRREELYDGRFIDRYPDVVLFLREGFGLGESPHSNIMLSAGQRSLSPGSHNIENACLVTNMRIQLEDGRERITLLNLHNMIANLLDIDVTSDVCEPIESLLLPPTTLGQ